MQYIIWMVAWFALQRLMMVFGIVRTDDLAATQFLTFIGFVACWISATNLLVVFYFVWVFAWGIGHIVHGGLLGVIPGVLVIISHILLYIIVVDKKTPTRRRTRRRRRQQAADKEKTRGTDLSTSVSTFYFKMIITRNKRITFLLFFESVKIGLAVVTLSVFAFSIQFLISLLM